MGTKQSSSQYSFLYSQWLFIQRNQRFDVYKQLRNNLQVEVYSLNYISKENLQLFDRRKNYRHPNVVQLVHFEILSQNDHYFCGKDTYAKVIIERTPFELKEYKQFSNKTIEDFIQQTFKGYQAIYQWYGPLRVQYGMIRFNNQGIIKVWINTNFSMNEISRQNLNFDGSEDFMVDSILKIFSQLINCIQICKKVKGFNEALRQLKNKTLIRSVQKTIAKNIMNNFIKITPNNFQQKQLNIQPKTIPNPSPQISTPINNKFLTKNPSFIFEKKNASYTQSNVQKNGIYIGRPSSNIPEFTINKTNNNNFNNYRPSQYLPRKAINNNNLIIDKSPPHTVTSFNFYNNLNTPKSSFNLSLNLNTPVKRQLSFKEENSFNSYAHKNQMVTPVALQEHFEEPKIQQQQTPRLGISSNKTTIQKYQDQRNFEARNLKPMSPKIELKYNINQNQNNLYRNLNLQHQFTLQQIKQDFLKKNKTIFNKLETIQKILQNNPQQVIKKFCILFKHALTIDRELYQQLQRVNCQFEKINNKQIQERIQKILTFIQSNNQSYLHIPSHYLHNSKTQFKTGSGKRLDDKQGIVNKQKYNQIKDASNNNIKFLPGFGVQQVQSILDSNRELALGQHIQQSDIKFSRNKSQTQKFLPNQEQQVHFKKEKQKRINTQERQSNNQILINQKNYFTKPKQELSDKIKLILAEQKKKRIQKGLFQTPNEIILKNKNQQRKSSALFEESHNQIKSQNISTGSLGSNHVTSIYNSNYNTVDSNNNFDNTIPVNKIEIPIIKDIQKIGRKKSKEISFGKNKFQDVDNTNQSEKKKVSYEDLKNDMQRLLKNSTFKSESKIKSENEAIEEKLKQKKNNFAKLKMEVAQVLGL